MLKCLERETQGHHARADAPWRALVVGDLSRAQYTAQLARLYGFEAPFEGALAYTPELPGEWRHRARSGLIAMDLLALGVSPAKIARLPQCDLIAPFRGRAEAFGWLYVVERATLWHEAVRHNLDVRRPEVANACAFLGASSVLSIRRWQELATVLERLSCEEEQIAIEAAHQAFTCQRMWLDGEQAAAISA